MTNQRCLGALLVACICLSSQMKAISAPDEARDVVTAWKQRHEAIKVVRYELSGEVTYTPEFFARSSAGSNSRITGETVKKPVSYRVTIDLRRSQGRVESNRWSARLLDDTLSFSPISGTLVWNKANCWSVGSGDREHYSRSRPQMIKSDDPGSRSIPQELDPLFWGHGVFRSINQKNTAANLWIDHPPGFLETVGVAPKSGYSIIRTEPKRVQSAKGQVLSFDELVVDRSKHGEIKKVSSRLGEVTVSRSCEAEYQSVAGSQYSLVKSLAYHKFSSNRLLESYTLQVTSVELDPKLESGHFEPTAGPGAYVQYDERVYIVESDGSWKLVDVDQSVVEANRTRRSPGSTADIGKAEESVAGPGLKRFVLFGTVAVIALIGIVTIIRRRSRSHSPGGRTLP